MIRKIIQIDEEKCNGCGLCAEACHEGAIDIIEGKARLMREDYCDGLGDCLPGCPTGAITFVEREAPEYNEQAVLESKRLKAAAGSGTSAPSGGLFSFLRKNTAAVGTVDPSGKPASAPSSGCPGSRAAELKKDPASSSQDAASKPGQPSTAFSGCPGSRMASLKKDGGSPAQEYRSPARQSSELRQWPCQIKLVPVNAPYFNGAKLLIAADCTAYAYANVHQEFMRGRITIIGCPKLDAVDYSQKLTQIISNNDIQEVVILRMEVPCCGGLQNAAVTALKNSGKFIPWRIQIVNIDGSLRD